MKIYINLSTEYEIMADTTEMMVTLEESLEAELQPFQSLQKQYMTFSSSVSMGLLASCFLAGKQ